MIQFYDNLGVLIQEGEQRLILDTVSTNLYSTLELYLLEEVFSTNEGRLALRTPLYENTYDTLYMELDFTKNFFFINSDESILSKQYTYSLELSNIPYIINGGVKTVTTDSKIPLNIPIGFVSGQGGEFSQSLKIYYKNSITNDTLLLREFQLYCTTVEDDIRYKILLNNLGMDISSNDYYTFFNSDINEEIPNNILLNEKRKELLYNIWDILPYIGSYKGIINALKYFGYNNVRIKEYWKNIKADSEFFGKLKQVEILTDSFNDNKNASIIWKKTNTFGLFFDLVVATDELDADGLPITEEVFTIPIQDIFKKITYLKNKLEKDFIMLNSRIIDIVAEVICFGKVSFKVSGTQNSIFKQNVNISPTVEIVGNLEMQVLRFLNYYGCPIGSDLTLQNTSNLLHHRLNVVQVGSAFLRSVYTLEIQTSQGIGLVTLDLFRRDLYDRDFYTEEQIAVKIVELANNSNDTIIKKHNFFVEPSNPTVIRIVQLEPLGISVINASYSDVNLLGSWIDLTFPYLTNIDVSVGSSYFGALGAPLSYYNDAILASFDSFQSNYLPFPDTPETLVGCPIILKNTTFDISLEDVDITFEELGNTQTQSFQIIGISSIDLTPPFPILNYVGDNQFILQPINGFDYNNYPSENSPSFSDIGHRDFYEGKWILTHENWSYDSGFLSLEDLKEHPVILPFLGTYRVELILNDLNGGVSTYIDSSILEVKSKVSDFIAWRQSGLQNYSFNEYVTNDIDSESVSLNRPLLLSEISSPLEHPIPYNESVGYTNISLNSFNRVNLYQRISYTLPNNHNFVQPILHTIENLSECTLENLDHIWFDMASPRLVSNRIYEVPDNNFLLISDYTNYNSFLIDNPNIILLPDYNSILSYVGVTTYIVDEISGLVYYYDGRLNLTPYKIKSVYIGDVSGLTQYERLLEVIEYVYSKDTLLEDNLYYLNWDYSDVTPKPYIQIVSRSYGYEEQYYFKGSGWILENESSYIDGGYMFGDIPHFFEIYSIDTLSNFLQIEGYPSLVVQSTTLEDLCVELNNSTNEGIKLFSFNCVYDEFDNILKLVAVCKHNIDSDLNIIMSGLKGVKVSRQIEGNPKLYDVRIDKFFDKPYKCGTVFNFCVDNSDIVGKTTTIWKVYKYIDNVKTLLLEYKSLYMSYIFPIKGWWEVECSIEDTNGNIYESKSKKINII